MHPAFVAACFAVGAVMLVVYGRSIWSAIRRGTTDAHPGEVSGWGTGD